jgi:putative glutamine amidotransferase
MRNPRERKPLIAVSSLPRPVSTGYGDDEADTIAKCFPQAVLAAGGIPLLLPVVPPGSAPAQLEPCDALVLSGGQDLAIPEAMDDPERWIDPDRDLHEIALWQAARERGIPILGICRGAQLANLASGGLVMRGVTGHNAGERYMSERHTVEVAEDTVLRSVVGAGKVEVNTIHSQAVSEIAPPFVVSARSPDGIIEGVEDRRPGLFLGVQWHPELMLDSPAGQPLFDWVVSAAQSNG